MGGRHGVDLDTWHEANKHQSSRERTRQAHLRSKKKATNINRLPQRSCTL